MESDNTFKELKGIALRELMNAAKQNRDRDLYFKLRKKYRILFPKIDGGNNDTDTSSE